ncbi:hypothetical protein J6590_003330 [Homalodisca vitripennis]|nr:hypothetical protein J6590_003330 [Homalodisca vitripennis]
MPGQSGFSRTFGHPFPVKLLLVGRIVLGQLARWEIGKQSSRRGYILFKVKVGEGRDGGSKSGIARSSAWISSRAKIKYTSLHVPVHRLMTLDDVEGWVWFTWLLTEHRSLVRYCYNVRCGSAPQNMNSLGSMPTPTASLIGTDTCTINYALNHESRHRHTISVNAEILGSQSI